MFRRQGDEDRLRAVETLDGLHVAVLGPLRVQVGSRPVAIRGRALRRLLIRLALARGALVPDGVLLRDVWGEEAALPVLHTAVARLRRELEPGRAGHAPGRLLVRDGTGYALLVARQGFDADRFSAAVRRGSALMDAGRPAEARAAFDEGLAEWAGAPLADAADRGFAEAEAQRLQCLREDALELRAAGSVALGDPGAVAELESFTASLPSREHAWELLVRALWAQGRPADALAAVRRARRVLRDTSGTDPGPTLTELQRAILRGDAPVRSHGRPAERGRRPQPQRLLPTSNLPSPISSMVGRQPELADLLDRLDRDRLVVLVGPGGAGKTRLASEACRRRHDPDGPWFVDLADVHDAALLPERIAGALRMGGTGTVDALAAALADRDALLLLDNCEQVAEAVSAVAEGLLAACPHLRILATSREPLGVAGEAVLPVAPLSPEDAVGLFLTRAREASGRVLAPEEVAEADALCADLDRLPLAIELAAGRTAALSVADLRAALGDRFALLRREGRTGRHATMLAAVEWSYRALDDDERAVFQALAVFRGGFRLDAAEAVTGRTDVALVVARLVARSMIAVTEQTPRRYRLLETLREHAERVTTPERRRALRLRHLDWVRDLAARSDSALRGRLSSTTTAELQEESANIRAALAIADPRTVLRVGGGFYWFWYREGLTEEGLGHLLPAIEASLHDREVDLGDRCRAAMGAALLLYLRGELPAAQEALAQAGADAADCGDTRVRAQYLSTLAYFEAGGGVLEPAQGHAEEALALAMQDGDGGAAAESLMVLGEVARRSGDLDGAAALLRDAAARATLAGYVWARISSEWIASKVELQAGRLGAALQIAVLSAAHAQQAEETTSWIVGLVTVAHLALLLDDAELAGVAAGAASWLGGRIGFSPARMDGELAAWSRALERAEERPAFAAAFARGRSMSSTRLCELLEQVTRAPAAAPLAV